MSKLFTILMGFCICAAINMPAIAASCEDIETLKQKEARKLSRLTPQQLREQKRLRRGFDRANERADAIFIGKVTKRSVRKEKSGRLRVRYAFDIEHELKGSASRPYYQIDPNAAIAPERCLDNFDGPDVQINALEKGESYVIYARRREILWVRHQPADTPEAPSTEPSVESSKAPTTTEQSVN